MGKGDDSLMNKKLRNALIWIIKNDGIAASCALLVMLLVLVIAIVRDDKISVWDNSFFFAILFAMLLRILSTLATRIIMNRIEDSTKLETDYELITKYYNCPMISYDNATSDVENIQILKKKYDKQSFVFPVVQEVAFDNRKLIINDCTRMYTLPDFVLAHYDELINAHISSNLYNQLAIRVDSWKAIEKQVVINTSRTTYYNSMVTNRVMDYKLTDGLSVRDMLMFGPYMPCLDESQLSNHLGMNGFLETSDGCIPFVKRNRIVSIGKASYANSIGASLKAKYALDSACALDVEGLRTAIIQEISDELKVRADNIVGGREGIIFISAYRDIVEGGKPQLLFYAKTKLDKAQLEANFYQALKMKMRKHSISGDDKAEKELEDGYEFLWIKRDELAKIAIAPGCIVYNRRAYAMMPSASASIVMLMTFLNKQ